MQPGGQWELYDAGIIFCEMPVPYDVGDGLGEIDCAYLFAAEICCVSVMASRTEDMSADVFNNSTMPFSFSSSCAVRLNVPLVNQMVIRKS